MWACNIGNSMQGFNHHSHSEACYFLLSSMSERRVSAVGDMASTAASDAESRQVVQNADKVCASCMQSSVERLSRLYVELVHAVKRLKALKKGTDDEQLLVSCVLADD